MAKRFKTTHKLDFLVAEYAQPINDGYNWHRFKIGTCEGLFAYRGNAFYILAIENTQKNNGHFDDVLEWFEYSCKKSKLSLVFLEVWNKKFREHLISKRGFQPQGVNVKKTFAV